jgi:phage terminase small subunit
MLTAKQEQFALNVVKGMTLSDAYRECYDCENSSDKTIWNEASELNNNPEVAKRIKELREQLAEPHIMTAKERLEFLTRVIKGEEKEIVHRIYDGEEYSYEEGAELNTKLKAVDLMNKMQGEYTTNTKVTVSYEDRLKEVVGEDEY